MKWLEKYLTRIPMYLLITGALGGLFIVALAAPFFDQVSFSPFALLASTATLLLVGMAASFGLGKLYSAPSHLPSALITSLILTFLFTPTLEPSKLILYALIAVLAQASKYVIAPRGRHIVNPAAFGAFMAGLVFHQYASWWIASPFFAGFVAVTGFLILYKTRQLLLGGVFLFVSIVALVLTGTSLPMALLSWPLLFFAGFMLSEPLTLPPKKWQKIVAAMLAGLLVALPFHIGDFFQSSPAFGLLLVNIFAFVVAYKHRRELYLTLSARNKLTPTTEEFVFESPSTVVFEPGQYAEFTLMQGATDARGYRRNFSITNAPGTNELRIGVKFYEPSSQFKKNLKALPIGSTMQTTGIYGDFTLPKDKNKKVLLVAGGIGITPFVSQVAADGRERDITVLYFVREPQDAAYLDDLRANGATVQCFSASEGTSSLTDEVLATYAPDFATRYTYISGPPAMVTSVKTLLRGKVKQIKTDYFSGY